MYMYRVYCINMETKLQSIGLLTLIDILMWNIEKLV